MMKRKRILSKKSLSNESGVAFSEFAIATGIMLMCMLGINALLGKTAVKMQEKAVMAQEQAVACTAQTQQVLVSLGGDMSEACK